MVSQEPQSKEIDGLINIRIIGVGGCGSNVVNRMIESGVAGADYAVVNTDAQALQASRADERLAIGDRITRLRGTGGDPDLGKRAAEESIQDIGPLIADADMVFVTAGMGGGTGTGAAPIIADLAKQQGALTVGVITLPFMFEGRPRQRNAAAGLQELQPNVDTLIIIHNDRLLSAVPASAPITEAFALADEMLVNGVRSITELVTTTGIINVDFADVRSVMQDAGAAMMGVGIGSGENRMLLAVEEAMKDPLASRAVNGARGVLLNFRGGPDMSIQEVSAAAEVVSSTVDREANIIVGASIDPANQEEVQVTLIATGLPGEQKQQSSRQRPAPDDGPAAPREPVTEAVEVEDLDLPAFLRRRRSR
jgi:cell division protein FtsZ